MKDFSIKDLLINIMHGAVVLCVVVIAFYKCFDVDVLTNSKWLSLTVITIACYLMGLFIDAIADFAYNFLVEKKIKRRKKEKIFPFLIYPSYFLLKDGECWDIKIANHKIIRKILSQDFLINDGYIKEQERENVPPEEIEKVWGNVENTMFLINYARNRAFRYATECQLNRIDAFFKLAVFFRNMVLTNIICIALFAVSCSNGNCSCFSNSWLVALIFACIILALISYAASYKNRVYYCRIVLGAIYSPESIKDKEKDVKITNKPCEHCEFYRYSKQHE